MKIDDDSFSYKLKFNFLGSEFELDAKSGDDILNRMTHDDLKLFQKYPNAQIIYIMHEKFIVIDRTNKKDRKLIWEKLINSFHTINWFTYRNEIEKPLIGSHYTSDAGWGCMIRTGQMLLC